MVTTSPKTVVKQSQKSKTESNWHLLLWNDDVNEMYYVMNALYELCGLSEQDAFSIMLEAHNKGQAFAKSGEREKMEAMQQGLNDWNINASVVKDIPGSN